MDLSGKMKGWINIMRKYRGRKHKRAMDTMKKFKIKGSVLYCREYNLKIRYFDQYTNEWTIATISYW